MPPAIRLALIDTPGASRAALAGLAEMFDHTARLHAREGLARVTLAPVRHSALPQRPPDAVILPPAFASRAYLEPPATLTRWLAALPRRTLVASACAGAFHLGAAGLLDGRRVTTHWALADDLARRHRAALVDADACLVRDGRVITAGGLMSWVDLALELIGHFSTPAILHEVGRHFVVDTGRRSQLAYRGFAPRLDHGDRQIAQAQRLLDSAWRRPPRLADLAAQVGLAPRSFQRRFARATGHSPRAYLLNLRMAAARTALETETAAIDRIAWQVGYENPNAFRKAFLKHVGLSPSSYRRRNRR